MSEMSYLRSSLDHEPVPLKFGTSGRRGEIIHMTQLEVVINALAELEYLQGLPRSEGGIAAGEEFYFASDLRPSSTGFVSDAPCRGELAQAIEAAIRLAGMKPVYLGCIPTPALTAYALARAKASIMVTGSHIPFDRNGYKTNTAIGELLKHHERPINEKVAEVRARFYKESVDVSIFGIDGQFKSGRRDLPEIDNSARELYIQRYRDFFGGGILTGFRVIVYQHSAVGRDILPSILRELGADVVESGRSESFVPIDTENIDADRLAVMQMLVDEARQGHGHIDALVSTDGDSDRPLILGVDAASGKTHFFGGDLVGMITAEFLESDAVVVPISCNDAIDWGALKDRLEPKTRIGSPYVIAGMNEALAKGKTAVCGWEANGGFLTGSDIYRQGNVLPALPTRDAVLPIVAVLVAAREQGLDLISLFEKLPKRYSRAALIKDFPRSRSQAIMARFSPDEGSGIRDVFFSVDGVICRSMQGQAIETDESTISRLMAIRKELAGHFTADRGFGEIERLNYTDGLRMYFTNRDVVHIRPSGNADELRFYTLSESCSRVSEMLDGFIPGCRSPGFFEMQI